MAGEPTRETIVEPFHRETVRVRMWDEGGKVAGMKTRSFRDYMPLLERVVRRHAATL